MVEHNYFDRLKGYWKYNESLPHNLKRIETDATEWKKWSISHVQRVKKGIMARLHGIQCKMQHSYNNTGLIKLETKLQGELYNVLRQEELMWFQRSRAKWLVDGDRNTRYYHLKTVNRRRHNKILILKDDSGRWIEDGAEIQKHVNEYYKKLFSLGERWGSWKQTQISLPDIQQEDLNKLGANVSNEEVRKAIFSMKPWKAPGPDGFPAGTEQDCCRETQRAYEQLDIPIPDRLRTGKADS
ncbi:uncharacterized protein LOC131597925 [Vicia villosa]|uniref:uncharacterized protein LOC131597925 n=1 Tax=Vicia villosa TaxID=3911 RepID=UPI00273CEC1C|nr:uncharacterized protein LOC131597925 [Vicia villosa]